jgi:hypothetical protein
MDCPTSDPCLYLSTAKKVLHKHPAHNEEYKDSSVLKGHAMKTYGGVEVKPLAVFTSTVDGGE